MIHLVLVDGQAVHDVKAPVREPIDVALEEPSTSGYVWQAAGAGAVSVVDAGIVPAGAAPGAASLHHFTVTATAPGRVTLEFSLRRPWEAPGPAAGAATLTIDAQ